MNAYDLDLYLRIALELYLKRLVVGGIERVYEIGRIFRNEGADSTHNPEFTMLEAYEAYGDYNTMATLTRELLQSAAWAALGGTVVRRPDGTEYDIGGQWRSVTVHEALSEALGEHVTPDTSVDSLRKLAAGAGVELQPGWGAAQILLELHEHLVEGRTVEPTFYRDFPVEVSPLTRQHRDDPRLAEKWDLVAFGTEIATAYSELVDPVEERARLTAQSLLAAGGDPEAMQLDEDFLRALEHGMPPSGGLGMGIDRMLIMLTGAGIRDTVLFPLVKPT
jgi:lysyl-tRNA synthetase, class II